MKRLSILLVFLQVTLVQGMNQKMILTANLETEAAAKHLYEVETFFQENTQAKALKEKHQLSLQLELLDTYVLVTIKPIRLVSVKNELKYVLQEKFPQYFTVEDTPMLNTMIEKKVHAQSKEVLNKEAIKTVDKKIQKIDTKGSKIESSLYQSLRLFWQDLDSEWLGLLFLALAGFLLIYRSARQIEKIKVLQNEVEKYQQKVENEMEAIGEKRG